MALQLFFHPFSSYSQKALTAFYEKDVAFTPRVLAPDAPDTFAEFARRWPMRRFPLLVDGTRTLMEATTIIEYLEATRPGAVRLIPQDAQAAVEVRMMDRVFDNYVSTPQQKLVFDVLRAPGERDPKGVADARAMLDTAYAWLDGVMSDREWAAGGMFSLADCAAGPFLFYADWCHPIDPAFANLRAYRARLLARPAFARAVDEARPYRHLFPLGAPDRD
ncbi:glutathione S-transferase family protein [Variovorax sp.]|uniref:glutathione S-transferase family protein n=1 Tax=Variovorax sp. TaxID=1871043 RepID=UPI002D2B23C9|nr:glutathione S-transferase family protein [Variovorax sp.]HYP83683.1 glutathione S-transferase family protein [Variovorax sp.]